jgi:hypothetical protein
VYVDEFEEVTGPAVDVPDSVREVFELIFTPSIVQYIVDETNKYAQSVMGDDEYWKWDKVGMDDVYAYFGIMIMMGLVQLPALHDYWSKNPLFYCPAIAERMPRDRFLQIHKFLHFADNDHIVQMDQPGHDRLSKVRPILDKIDERFMNIYHPHKECAIDEAMVPYKGRSVLKQYMPMKPVRRGLKVWMRADSQNGFVSQFQVYVGKEVSSSETGLGSRVVRDLTRTLVNKKFHIYCDNFFTSIPLFSELMKEGIYACGTIRANRKGFPTDLKWYVKNGFLDSLCLARYSSSNHLLYSSCICSIR